MKNSLMVFAALTLVLNFTSCKKDKKYQTDMLAGKWSFYSSDGVLLDQNYIITYEFDTDFNFEICEQSGGVEVCYGGSWEWLDDDQTEVGYKLLIGGELFEHKIKIESLTEDVLKGELTNDGVIYEVELHRIE